MYLYLYLFIKTMSTQERLEDKLEILFADVPLEELQSVVGTRESLLKALGKAKVEDIQDLHALSDMRVVELEQERLQHQNRRGLYSLLGNVSGAAAAAWIGFIQEPFENVRSFVSDVIIRGANEADPRYVGHLKGEFADNLSSTIDQVSRVPTSVVAGILGWVVVGYLAKTIYNRGRGFRDIENQYSCTNVLKVCSEETIRRKYGR